MQTKGIDCDILNVQCLIYADDLVLISESTDDLQCMLNVLHEWCHKWRMKVNINKTKVMHFRVQGYSATDSRFTLGKHHLEIVDKYKYLGIILHYLLHF